MTMDTIMYTLPKINYSYDALEPYIDAKTMEIHHTKHHQTYVNNLNKALEGHTNWHDLGINELLGNIEQVPENIRLAVRNNGGGHFNHSLFWNMLGPGPTNPSGDMRNALEAAFGSLDSFKEEFKKSALGRFGSGWAWLVKEKSGQISILSTPNQDSPISEGKMPLLTVDVWEHAYYLKYQNKRDEYVDNWWNVVNWDYVSELFSRQW